MKLKLTQDECLDLLVTVHQRKITWEQELKERREAWEKVGYADVIKHYEEQVEMLTNMYLKIDELYRAFARKA